MQKIISFILYLCFVFAFTETNAQNTIDYSSARVEISHQLSSDGVDYAASIAPDGKTILFVSNRHGSVLGEQTYDEEGKPNPRFHSHDIWQTEIRGDTFDIPKPIDPLNTPLNEGTIIFGKDMKHLFFTACNTNLCYGACDIFHFDFVDTTWVIKNVGNYVNSVHWDSQPSYGKNGTLYFLSNLPISEKIKKDNMDIFAADLDTITNTYKKAQRLGDEVNTKDREAAPFYSFYEDALYFSSNGHLPNYGGLDLYRCKRNADGTWQKPENLGKNINSEADDFFITISRDGKNIFFSSNRPSEFGKKDLNIYRVIMP